MFGFDTLFEDSIRTIRSWKPTQKYGDEGKYQKELIDILKKELNERQDPYSLGQKKRITISSEAGRGLCDIGINRQIGIELKKDLKKKAQIDRLAGQIMEFKKDYQDLIIVLVGDTDKDKLDLLKDKMSDLSSEGDIFSNRQGHRIRVIDKGSQIKEIEKQESKPEHKSELEQYREQLQENTRRIMRGRYDEIRNGKI